MGSISMCLIFCEWSCGCCYITYLIRCFVYWVFISFFRKLVLVLYALHELYFRIEVHGSFLPAPILDVRGRTNEIILLPLKAEFIVNSLGLFMSFQYFYIVKLHAHSQKKKRTGLFVFLYFLEP